MLISFHRLHDLATDTKRPPTFASTKHLFGLCCVWFVLTERTLHYLCAFPVQNNHRMDNLLMHLPS